MLKVASVLIAVLVTSLAYLGFKGAFGDMNLRRILPHTVLFYLEIVSFSIVGIEIIYCTGASSMSVEYGVTEQHILLGIITVMYSSLLFPYIISAVWGHSIANRLSKLIQEPFQLSEGRYVRPFFVCFTCLSLLVVFYLYKTDAPIFQLLSGSISRVLTSRVSYTRTYEGSYFIKNVLGQGIVVLVSYCTFLYYAKTRQRFWLVTFILNFICAFIISGASLSKSGIVWYLIPYLYFFVLIKGSIPLKQLTVIATLLVLIVLISYAIQTGTGSLLGTLLDVESGPISRIFRDQIESLPQFFVVFPNMHDFTYGAGIAILRFFGIDQVESARVVASVFEPTGVSEGWVGVHNTLYIGDAYANFGIVGIIVSPFIVALWYGFFYRRLVISPKTPVNVACYIQLLELLTEGYTGGFCSTYLVNTQAITVICFLFLFNLLTKDKRRSNVIVKEAA